MISKHHEIEVRVIENVNRVYLVKIIHDALSFFDFDDLKCRKICFIFSERDTELSRVCACFVVLCYTEARYAS